MFLMSPMHQSHDPVRGKHWTVGGTPTHKQMPNGAVGYETTWGSNYFTSGPITLPVGQWTIATQYYYYNSAVDSAGLCGFAEAPGSTTYDRQIQWNGVAGWSIYIYDGAAKRAGVIPSEPVPYVITQVGTTNGSTLRTYWLGHDLTPKGWVAIAVSNSGYTSYTTPEFLVGYTNSVATTPVATVSLALVTNRYWNEAMAVSFLANPWQIFLENVVTKFTSIAAAPPTGNRRRRVLLGAIA